MTLEIGTRLGPYEIAAPLGAGGMGEVYRARDTRLGRDVAIKVLAQPTVTPEARQRFEREARAISSLNHPHVCTLHDVGHEHGLDFLVMELVEGETLASRLDKGPMSTADVLRVGIDVASALEKAHRHGILHRDLKPANIMLTKAGAKLMDFGLAKAAPSPTPVQSLTPPTRTTPLTAEGTIVGTCQYMSPEQIEGGEADARSDIFSFGAVLYEMATGTRAFDGKTTASVIAAVLGRDPAPISTVQPMSPPALDRTVRTCLAKDPDERFQSAHDVKLELEWIREPGLQAAVPTRARRREAVAWIAVGVLAALALALGYVVATRAPAPSRPMIAQLAPPPHASFALGGNAPGMPALSPDGHSVAFVAQMPEGRQTLWVQSLDAAGARSFDGTDRASRPFWSPDGGAIGYFQKGNLYRIDASGGPANLLAQVGPASGGSWSRSGTILVGSHLGSSRGAIYRVPASGGKLEAVVPAGTSLGEIAYPQFLPDGTHFLFYAAGTPQAEAGLYVASLDRGDPRLVLRSAARAFYAAPGYLLFARGGNLMAQPFNADTQQLSGDAAPLVDSVDLNAIANAPAVAVSDSGVLVYNTARLPSARIVWYDRSGNAVSSTGAPGGYGNPAISPDGKRLAVSFGERENGFKPDIWVYDLTRDVKTRVTSEVGISADAGWSADSERVTFVSNRNPPMRIYEKAADGTGSATLVVPNEDPNAAEFFPSWSADGRYVAFQRTTGAPAEGIAGPVYRSDVPSTGGIWAFDTRGESKPFPVVQRSQFVAIQPALSPDAKWLAYVSDESGQMEVYAVPFPRGNRRYLVSSGGGTWPRWRRDGKELWYRQGGVIMSVDVLGAESGLTIGKSHRLFQADPAPGGLGPMYDASADGQRFVVVTGNEAEAAKPLTLILNWPALLRGR